jgi:hypothetical protein
LFNFNFEWFDFLKKIVGWFDRYIQAAGTARLLLRLVLLVLTTAVLKTGNPIIPNILHYFDRRIIIHHLIHLSNVFNYFLPVPCSNSFMDTDPEREKEDRV